ncbi:MAG: ABC transporter permease [Thermodesulfobacteriota bacterium]
MNKIAELILKRFIYLIFTMLLVSIIVFLITQVMPGDVATAILGQSATKENIEILREELGLNRPTHDQYLSWLKNTVSFDLGNSLSLSRPIAPILWERMKRSLSLSGVALFEVIVIGISLGILASLKKDKPFDQAASAVSFVLISIPEFVSGSLLILVVGGGWFNFFPSSGYASLNEGFGNWLWHLVLPSTTLTMVLLAYVLRMMRADMIEVLRQNYIRTARLNGLPESRVILVHALKNSLIPTVTLLANNIGWMIGGIVVVEKVFAYPGVGLLLIHAINYRDIPLIQATIMSVATIYVLASLLADLAYFYLDPRTRD